MMRTFYFLLFWALMACNQRTEHKSTAVPSDSMYDNPVIATPVPEVLQHVPAEPDSKSIQEKLYSNARFRDVTVEKTGTHRYLVKGKAQVFEANISWVVEDGHRELKKGYQTTDAGAPEWGNFHFTIEVEKDRPQSVLTLILFESSAKDGSRQHELPIVLQ